MSIKAEQLLEQLRGIETFIEKERLDEARSAINGIRYLLLTEPHDNDETYPERSYSDSELTALIDTARAEQALGNEQISGAAGRCEFDQQITCWGWYDAQIDSGKRRYRWCGGEREAGLILPFSPAECAAVVMSVRPFNPDAFGIKSIEMTLNGRPSVLRLLKDRKDGVFNVIIEPKALKAGGLVEICFHIKHGEVPAKKDQRSSDLRALSFNAYEFIWLPRG